MENTPMKRFQLMQRVNIEGLYGTVQAALPHLKQEKTGRIIVVSPPIYSRFFRGKTAYAMGKVGMSVLTKGLAMDFERQGLKNMAITSIWPAAVRISTQYIWIKLLTLIHRPSSRQLRGSSPARTLMRQETCEKPQYSLMLFLKC